MADEEKMLQQALDKSFDTLTRLIRNMLIKAVRDRGHVLTNKLINSINFTTKKLRLEIEAAFEAEDYGRYLDRRLPADKIPYSRPGIKKKSKVIEALIKYFRRRGANSKRAKNYAFGTVTKWKQENGRPTAASRRFSRAKDNTRVGWISDTLQEINKLIRDDGERILAKNIVQVIEISFSEVANLFEAA